MPSAASSGLGRARVVPGQSPHDPQVVEGVGLAQPVAEVAVDAQRLPPAPGRARIVPGRRRTAPRSMRALASPCRSPRSR